MDYEGLIDARQAMNGALDWLTHHAADAPELRDEARALARGADEAAEACHWGLSC